MKNQQVEEPLISVCIIAYNKEDYIAQTLDGILMQQTNNSYEIVIGEDCSTDNTRAICLDYQKRYPHQIKLLLHEKNLGVIRNFEVTMKSCTGKYIAICDADDYWIDPLKLKKQVDFLEKHNCTLVHTATKLVVGECFLENRQKKQDYNFEQIIMSNPIITSTVLGVRKDLHEAIDKIFSNERMSQWSINDYPLWLEIAQKHQINYLDEITTVYRVLEESESHTKNKQKLYLYDKNIVSIKEFFYKEKINISYSFKKRFYEMIFHARKRMLLDYRWLAKEQILQLLKINPVFYFHICMSKIKRSLKKRK